MRTRRPVPAGPPAARFAVPALALALTVAVTGPMLHGHLFLLDWHVGSHNPLLPRAARGLDGGVAAGLPGSAVFEGIARLIGQAAGWLPFAVFFPLAGAGAARLIGTTAEGRLPRVVGGLFYAANPFVFDRVAAGQVGVLLGYALLPFAVASMLRASEAVGGTGVRRLGAAGWWAGMTALSVHYLWIGGLLLLGVVVARGARPRVLLWAGASIAGVAVLSAYLLFAQLGQARPVTVGASDVAAYATRADPHYGLFVNALGLYGFWRQGPALPKTAVPIWPVLLAGILVVAVVGAVVALRDPARRPLAVALVVAGTAGYLLALGTQGPTGGLFRLLFDHVPLFDIMREPQKFLGLTALAEAVLLGWGARALTAATRDRALRTALTVLVVALPVAYSPTFLDGLSRQVVGVTVPAGFAQADAAMGAGPEQVLVLPWHQYLGFPWSHGVIANPAPVLFRRTSVVGDDVELPGVYSTSTSSRSTYLQSLYALGAGQTTFGASIGRLDIGWVVVAKTADWKGFDWLRAQTDVRIVLDTPDLTLYAVTAPVSAGARVGTETPLVRRSPTSYGVPPGPAGRVEVAEPFDAGWRLDGVGPAPTPQGTMSFPVGPAAAAITFPHARTALAGDLVSLLAALALAGATAVQALRRRRADGSANTEV